MNTHPDERKAGLILAMIALIEGTWVLLNLLQSPRGFLRYTGFVDGSVEPWGWLAAFAVVVFFTAYAAQLPSVRANLFTFSSLKVLGLLVAIAAGFCEEAVFRKLLMNGLAQAHVGVALQVLGSGVAFGLVHGVWGLFRGSLMAGLRATAATGVLGLALALVFVASHRLLAPCVVAHLLINAFAEPGLVLAAVRGEMSGRVA